MKWDPEWVVLSMLAGGVLTLGIAILALVIGLITGQIECGCG